MIKRPVTGHGGWMVDMITKIVLFIVFYFFVFPVGLISRLTTKDPLRRKIENGLPTYWENW